MTNQDTSSPSSEGVDMRTALLARLVEIDFEESTITLKALAQRWPPLSAGNYVVVTQQEWAALRTALNQTKEAGE